MALKDWGNSKIHFGYYDKQVGVSDDYGVFAFAAAAPVSRLNQVDNRCDFNHYGPVCVDWNGVDPYRLPPYVKSLANLKFLKPIIDCAPDFYIIYYESQESDHEVMIRNYDNLPSWQQQAIDAGWQGPQEMKPSKELEDTAIMSSPHRAARTLGELFKLILEWEEVSKDPFNNTEPVCNVACKILDKLDMPQEVRDELWQAFPDSHVVRYIRNDPGAQERPDGVPNITSLFDAWIEGKLLAYPYRGPIVLE